MPFKLFAHPLGVLADAVKEKEESSALVKVVHELEFEVRDGRAYRKVVVVGELTYDEMIEQQRSLGLNNALKHDMPWENSDDDDVEDIFHFELNSDDDAKAKNSSVYARKTSMAKSGPVADLRNDHLITKEDKGEKMRGKKEGRLNQEKEPFPQLEKHRTLEDRAATYSPAPVSESSAYTRPGSAISGKKSGVSDSMRGDFSSSAKKLGTKASTVFRKMTKRDGAEPEPEHDYLPSLDLDPPATKVIKINEIEKFKRMDQVERYAQLQRLHYWEMTGVARDDAGEIIEDYEPYVDPGDPMEDNLVHRERKARLRKYGLSGIPPIGGNAAGEATRSFTNGYFDNNIRGDMNATVNGGKFRADYPGSALAFESSLEGDDIFGSAPQVPINDFRKNNIPILGTFAPAVDDSFYGKSQYTSDARRDTQHQQSIDELDAGFNLEKPSIDEIRQRTISNSSNTQPKDLKDTGNEDVTSISAYSELNPSIFAKKENKITDYETFMAEASKQTSALTIAERIARIKYAPYYKEQPQIAATAYEPPSTSANDTPHTQKENVETENNPLALALVQVPQADQLLANEVRHSVSSSTARPSNDGPNSQTTIDTATPNALVTVPFANAAITAPLPIPAGVLIRNPVLAGPIVPAVAKKEKGFSRALAKLNLNKKEKKKPLREESGFEFALTPLSQILEQTGRDYEVCKNRIAELEAAGEVVDGVRADYDECKRDLDNFLTNVYQPYLNGELAGQNAAGEDVKIVGVLSKRSDMWRAKMRDDVGQQLVLVRDGGEDEDGADDEVDFHQGLM